MAETPRIESARIRAASAKRALAVLSVAGFFAAFVLARAAHPGASASPATPSEDSSSQSQREEGQSPSFGFGGSSIAPPQTAVPNVQSTTS